MLGSEPRRNLERSTDGAAGSAQQHQQPQPPHGPLLAPYGAHPPMTSQEQLSPGQTVEQDRIPRAHLTTSGAASSAEQHQQPQPPHGQLLAPYGAHPPMTPQKLQSAAPTTDQSTYPRHNPVNSQSQHSLVVSSNQQPAPSYPGNTAMPIQVRTEKSVALAAFLTIFFWGSGVLYVGRNPGVAVGMYVAALITLPFFFIPFLGFLIGIMGCVICMFKAIKDAEAYNAEVRVTQFTQLHPNQQFYA